MKIKFLNIFLFVSFSYTSFAFAATPHWSHEDQATWWGIPDPAEGLPLTYPFAECGVGKHQAPIDLAATQIDTTQGLNKVQALYPVDTPIFFNSGHGVQVNTSSNYKGELKIGEESYPLIQFHFHEPSEHVIDGQPFAAELHYVHVRDDGRIVVLAVAIAIGAENTTFQTILDNTPDEESGKNSDTKIQINPASLLPASLDTNSLNYYTFAGSLTTPPCSEGVQWYLLSEIITISSAQLEQLKGFYSNNARSAQDINGRILLSN
ncbi:carbonic anhydrase [Nitrosomonas sp. PY1]|uniref:carbonic anhydrase n=1 Tax=Nitrosomonas sp. PY1 TaxID=1803906 RepID=UPI001FC8384F|nr:carbonic anhydrase family protein [Nitrosomonas sp. PY1]GKS68106.1 carbonic anhydrase [Nitrosomonas sp. PY1]